jgi:hypothetical protein
MEKQEFTEYLEKHLIEFLQNLGHHYRKTINNRASDYDVLALNELGTIYVKKYYKYKKQHPKYSGPINWLTRITLEGNDFVFENPPPDSAKRSKTAHRWRRSLSIRLHQNTTLCPI